MTKRGEVYIGRRLQEFLNKKGSKKDKKEIDRTLKKIEKEERKAEKKGQPLQGSTGIPLNREEVVEINKVFPNGSIEFRSPK